ncbi:MAG TPA: glycosyltransferase family 1 protein, partial [Mycobacteriales bacterium]|nr:glycosyltransferase family 1 protein [Mycobacteriales bacterium]
DLPAGVRRVPLRRPGPARLRDRQHDWRLPHDLRRARPAGTVLTPGRTPPARSPVPFVQTLHDLTPLVVDAPQLANERRHWQRVSARLRDAHRIIAVSRATADTAIRLLGVDGERVVVIPHGVDPSLHADERDRATDVPVLLWVSSWGPHKGLPDAIATIDALADAGHPHVLHLAGWNDAWMRQQVDAAVARARHPDRVRVLGYVDDIGATYRRATALLVTSRCEGFCLPAAEAMACGTPVIAYDNTALPELVGDAGVLVADGELRAFIAATQALLDDPHAAADRALRGIARARTLTWEASVAAHAEVLRDAARAG